MRGCDVGASGTINRKFVKIGSLNVQCILHRMYFVQNSRPVSLLSYFPRGGPQGRPHDLPRSLYYIEERIVLFCNLN